MTTPYQPSFDTKIRKSTEVKCHRTVHVDYIDWDDYPFDDPSITANMCCDENEKQDYVELQKEYLRICENHGDGREVFASNDGGWPRILQRVMGVGMVSDFPYWTPRPAVCVLGTLGCEWIDWASLTWAEVRESNSA